MILHNTYIFLIMWTLRSLFIVECHSFGPESVMTRAGGTFGRLSVALGICSDMLSKRQLFVLRTLTALDQSTESIDKV